ncbi:hypothetical protein CKAH01_05086 [Colletotrichum kahawae]|uniref:Uncharacterized protein n=1 Tax=Colletotrichum kahawae TaxID=34407 RepID=A0AAD9YGN9_COLKA|nr:hypothetical protein CKAH01_05086 [Colletotrichum kahawae]
MSCSQGRWFPAPLPNSMAYLTCTLLAINDWDLPQFWQHKRPASRAVGNLRRVPGFDRWFLAPVTDRKRDETQRRQEDEEASEHSCENGMVGI